MNIVNFTPQSAFLGGIIIGLAVIIFFIGNGRLAGISGIVNATLVSKQNRTDNFLFIVGLVLGPIFYVFFTKIDIPFLITSSLPIIITAKPIIIPPKKADCGVKFTIFILILLRWCLMLDLNRF